MSKDIRAINEAYTKATTRLNEEAGRDNTPDLSQIYSRYKPSRLIEVWHPTYLNEEDTEPTSILYVFYYDQEDGGDRDTPPVAASLDLLGSFDSDGNYVDVSEEDASEAEGKAWSETESEDAEDCSYC